MIGILLAGVGLLGTCGAPSDEPDAQQWAVYERAQQEAGQNPDANVKLALWCEKHGLRAERARHLAIALLAEPNHLLARALSGLVKDGVEWVKPGAVAERIREDRARQTLFDEYVNRRAKAALEVGDQLELARWCEEQGLVDQMRVHLITVVRLDPSRESTWKRLGFTKHDGRWMTRAQIDAAGAEAKARKEADTKWVAELRRIKEEWRKPKNREAAAAKLAEVSDPRAVPAILEVFGGKNEDLATAVQLLGQIDDPASSRVLAWIAVAANSPEVRRTAVETLMQRDPREYAGLLVGLVRTPLKYEVRPIGGPGSPGVLFVEGERFNLQRIYRAPIRYPNLVYNEFVSEADTLVMGPTGQTGWLPRFAVVAPQYEVPTGLAQRIAADPSHAPALLQGALQGGGSTGNGAGMVTLQGNHLQGGGSLGNGVAAARIRGIPIVTTNPDPFANADLIARAALLPRTPEGWENQRRYEQAALNAQAQLQRDMQWVEATNADIARMNERVLPVLQQTTGMEMGGEARAWQGWWNNLIGINVTSSYEGKPTITQVGNFQPAYLPERRVSVFSCFKAGTLVQTDHGPVAIEQVAAGDMVLSQDETTGALAFEPVVALRRNPPSQLYRLRIGDEELETTGLHRYWKAGVGWVMGRELKAGDEIRALGRLVRVTGNEPSEVAPVYNLIVDPTHNFFVGRTGVLAHDDTLPDRRIQPFDRVEELVTEVR